MKNLNLKKVRFKEAKAMDIEQMQVVRNSVKENVLTTPDLVTDADYLDFITNRGKGWVCKMGNHIIGFAVVDLKERNIWALFVDPTYEKGGIGKQLQRIMLNWYFDQTSDTIWLGTDPKTRAESFYRKSGWLETGIRDNGEIRFEMTYENWKRHKKHSGII